MKRLVGVTLLVGLLMAGYVYGVNSDSFEVSVTPVLTYSVEVSTPAGGLDFGSRELDGVYILTTSATIRNNGNVRADWTLKATPLSDWRLGSSLTDNGLDKVVLAALLNSSVPQVSDFTDNDVLTTTEKNADSNNFAGDQTGNDVAKNQIRLLWLYLRMPTDTTVDTTQKFRIEVKAYPANRF